MSREASAGAQPRAGTAASNVWGSLVEPSQAATLDTFLSLFPSVVFARVTTSILRAAGYQVLDSPGTSALKAACNDKPKAASVTLGSKASEPWVLSGPTIFNGNDFTRMGFKTFYSLTSSRDRQASLYFPFLPGSAEGRGQGGGVRTSALQSPLYRLPTRMVVNVLDKDQLECRMEWQADEATCRRHGTALWVVQDRYLNHVLRLAPDAVQASLTGLLVNALLRRANIAKEASGSLWFADQPENVTPFAPGLAYALTVAALPVFSSSRTLWSKAAWDSAPTFAPPTFPKDTRVDYLTVFPRYTAERHTEYLKTFARGFEDVAESADWRLLAGFAYQVALPKDVSIGRTFQLSQSVWSLNSLTITTPSIMSPSGLGGSQWPVFKREQDSIALRCTLAANITSQLSVAVGVLQKATLLGLDSPALTPSVGLGKTTAVSSLNFAFTNGSLQVAMEGASRLAAMLDYSFASSPANVTLSLGAKWDRGGGARKLSYGGGVSLQF